MIGSMKRFPFNFDGSTKSLKTFQEGVQGGIGTPTMKLSKKQFPNMEPFTGSDLDVEQIPDQGNVNQSLAVILEEEQL